MKNIILVAGGAGFIGSYICEKLLQKNNKVICLDNFDPYYDPNLKRRNIQGCLKDSNFKMIQLNILDKEKLENLFREENIESIIHVAARPGVRSSVKKSIYLRRN